MKKDRLILFNILFMLTLSTGVQAEEGLSLKDLAVPESLGKVESRFIGDSEHWVIHIQDVHAHFAAQENIAAIIDHLNQHYGVDTVGLEGGWSETTFPNSWGIPNSREKQLLARELLQRDYLTGPAFAALFSKTPMHLIGIEEETTYEKNRLLFVEHLKIRKTLLEKLKKWEEMIAAKKEATYNPALYSFDQALLAFRKGKKAEKFIPDLIRTSQKSKVDFSDLDQVMLFEKIIEKDKALNKDKLKSEAERLMKQFKKLGLNFEELLRSGKIPEERLEFYPATRNYIEIMKLRDNLNYHTFFDQLETSITRLKDKLYTSEEEKKVDQEASRGEIANMMTLLEATPQDVKKFFKQKEMILKEAVHFELVEGLKLAEEFYILAKERDNVFFDSIQQDKRFQKNIAVVTGGFHTEGFTKKLIDQNISHIIITPDLAEQEPNKELYFQRIQQALPGASAIQTLIETTFMHPRFDRAFLQGLKTLSKTRNILKAVEVMERILNGEKQFNSKKSKDALSMEDFLALSKDEQIEEVKKWLNLLKTSKVPIAVLSMQANMIRENEIALTLFREFISHRLNKTILGIPVEDIIHEEAIVSTLRRVRANNIEEVLSQRSIERQIKNFIESKHAAVIDSDHKSNEVLVLPPNDITLLIVRPLVEGYLTLSSNAEIFSQFEARVKEILLTLELFESIQSAA